ncbi:DUF916 and DUF3324 domain-containing protein [Vagococcus penaei]|nr:DUF916 and DUF3324 domain-containing protein [Vagococcus penaei]
MEQIVQKKTQNNINFFLFFATLVAVPTANFAAEQKDEALSFKMNIVPPDSQKDKKTSYFDLKVKPNETLDLKINVSNTGNDKKKIRVTPTNAQTNQNGVIDYSIPGKDYKPDSTLKFPFTSLVDGGEQTVEIDGGKSKEVTFKVKTPSEAFKGLILGGFVADLPDVDQKNEKTEGVKIVNKFQVVKAVMLRESDEKVAPELKMNDVKPALVGYRTAVTANLQNVEPEMFGKMKVDAEVTKKGSTEVIKKEVKEGLEMAPNSNFDYPIMWNNQRLEPGDYTLKLTATSGSKTWPFTKDFTISRDESDKLNKDAVDLAEPEGLPIWVYILIGVLILLVIVIIIIVIRNAKNKKNTKSRKSSSSKKGSGKSSSKSSGKSRKSSGSSSKKKRK